MEPIREALDELIELGTKKIDVSTAFATACNAVAQKANIKPAAVKEYVMAVCRERVEDWGSKVSQLEMLFEEFAK